MIDLLLFWLSGFGFGVAVSSTIYRRKYLHLAAEFRRLSAAADNLRHDFDHLAEPRAADPPPPTVH